MSDEMAFSGNQLEMIPAFTPEDQKLIASELERLYAFQDRQLTADKKAIFVQALSQVKLPLQAIVQAIEEMMLTELERIKLPMIIAKARDIANRGAGRSDACQACLGGIVLMKDENSISFALACECPAGQGHRRSGMATWNGEDVLVKNGRTLRLEERIICSGGEGARGR